MKRIKNNKSLNLAPINLSFNDLEHIINELSVNNNLKILHKNYEYESLDEMKTHLSIHKINDLEINASGKGLNMSYLTIQIKPEKVCLYFNSDSISYSGLIEEIIRSSTPWYLWRPNGMVADVMLKLISLILLSSSSAVIFAQKYHSYSGVMAAILILLSLTITFKDTFIFGSTIQLNKESIKTTFFERNKDSIATGVIMAIISSLITFFFTKYLS